MLHSINKMVVRSDDLLIFVILPDDQLGASSLPHKRGAENRLAL